VICGSFAYDSIMIFPDRFKRHILPDQIHILNVSFLVPEMRREFGGCAGNIAYNLKLLGGDGLPIMGTVGDDFAPYASAWMDATASVARCAEFPIPTPRRPSSPPTSTTTRSPPSTPVR
jgi:sugar/nucleoside kinase (ribokinase family)